VLYRIDACPSHKREKLRLNLGTKISLLTSLLVFISTGILGFFLLQQQENSLVERALDGIKGQLQAENSTLEGSISELIKDVRFISHTPPIQGIIRAMQNNGVDPVDGSTKIIWKNRLSTIFRSFLLEKDQYLQIRYIGISGEGKEIVRADRMDGEPHITEDSNLQTKGESLYFKETIKLPPGTTYLSSVSLNREHGKITTPHQAVLRSSFPIYDANNKVFGIIIINMDFSAILNELIKHNEQLFIVNGDGDYLGNQDPKLNFGFDLGKRYKVQTEYPELVHFFEEGNSDNNFTYTPKKHDQGNVISALKTKYGFSEKKSFIALIYIQKISAIITESKEDINNTLFLIFSLIILSTLTGFYFSRRLTSPLMQISHATAKFSAGEEEVKLLLPADAKDEIGDLARSFQSMTQKVKARTNELAFQKRAIDEHAIVSIADVKGNITFVNDKFCQISGYSRDELMGRNHRVVISGEHPPEFFKNMWATISSGEVWHGDIKNKNKGGGYYWVRTTIVPNLGVDGKPFQYIGIRTEITENKNLEEALVLSKEEAEKANLAKSLFLANMSHEIRTPMNAILGFSQILLRKKDLDRDTKDSLKTIDTSGRNLLTMINEILDISKIEAGKMELNISDFDLKPLLEHVAQLFELRCQKKQLDWVVADFSNSILVRGDEIKLQQILVNLLGNAVKFTDSGKVELVVTPLENDQFKFC